MRPRCFCGCGRRAAQRHHVVYQQELRHIAAGRDSWAPSFFADYGQPPLPSLLAEPANLVWVNSRCHYAHHDRSRPFPLRRLPDGAIAFAFALMGPRAAIYLQRRYAGFDRRLQLPDSQYQSPPGGSKMGADVDTSTFRQQIDAARDALLAGEDPDVATTHDVPGEELPPIENVPLPGVGDAAPADVEAPTEPTDLIEKARVDGTTQLGIFEMGGKPPTHAKLQITSGQLEVAQGRAFKKGDRVRVEGIAEIREVRQTDKVDRKSGIINDCVQGHTAVLIDAIVSPADDE
jgi:hypothetical protein